MYINSYSNLGKRESNEDTHEVKLNRDISLFAIYDGHGGDKISKFLKGHLLQYFEDKKIFDDINKFEKYVSKIFDHMQKQFYVNYKHLSEHCGSTAIICVIIKNIITVINLGDCRAIMANEYNIANQLSKDHKPDSYEEKKRIKSLGGRIYKDGDDWRIKEFSLARSFGDLDGKPYISHLPDVFHYKINKNDKCIVLACDGLWDVMSNQEVFDFIRENVSTVKNNYASRVHYSKNSDKNVAKSLSERAIKLGSHDNITIIIIFFRSLFS